MLFKMLTSFAAALLLGGCSSAAEEPAAPPVMPVTVAQPLVEQVVDWDDYVGRFEAVQESRSSHA